MTAFSTGDLVVLISGSLRKAVEAVVDDRVACVWCNEGEIGRDNFDARLLKKWEVREDDRGPRGRGDDRGGGRPHRGDREGGGKPYRGDRDRDDRGRDDRGRDDDRKPRGKTGWAGNPREKKFFRKDDYGRRRRRRARPATTRRAREGRGCEP
ncbi:MAG: hypothetical protein AAF360_19290 [Pseudomonadota bacterium]